MSKKRVVLKKDKERFVLQNRHPWIFSGAISTISEDLETGDVASIYSYQGDFLAQGYFHLENSLAGRILSFDQRPIQDVLKESIQKAWFLRSSLLDFSKTNCFRLINAEEDDLPGLVVDYYDKTLVLQINTCGMEKLKPLIVDLLVKEIRPDSIYEKSTSSSRVQEGLVKQEGLLFGKEVLDLIVQENGIPFSVSIVEGQKTGFFLDQREMRKKIQTLSKNRSVLNCFSYSGGFSLYALHGGAKQVTSVDICAKASLLCRKNTELSGFSKELHEIIQEDVFAFLKTEEISQYDVIILDPPAFAKKRQDIDQAAKGYRQINQAVFEKAKPGTLLLTCSCSYFMNPDLFQQVLFQAASESRRKVKILSKHISALDHPVSLYHPEGEYLKSLLLWID